MNVGIFRAGSHAAVIPGSAYLSLNIVYAVEEAEQARAAGHPWGGAPIRARFEETVRAAEAGDEEARAASGLPAVEAFLRDTLESGELLRLKLGNPLGVATCTYWPPP